MGMSVCYLLLCMGKCHLLKFKSSPLLLPKIARDVNKLFMQMRQIFVWQEDNTEMKEQ